MPNGFVFNEIYLANYGGGFPVGPPGPPPPPQPPSIFTLLANSFERLMKSMTDDCAKAIGAKNADEAITKLGRENVGAGDLGRLVLNNGMSVGGPLANTNPADNRITFNTEVNWNDPDNSTANVNGVVGPYDLLGGERALLNAEFAANGSSFRVQLISAQQLMDLVMIHELAHNFGKSYDGRDYLLWQDCFKH
jgi:hypothetical protein